MYSKCNICSSPVIDAVIQVAYADGAVDECFERRCIMPNCKNLVYGSIKRIKNKLEVQQ